MPLNKYTVELFQEATNFNDNSDILGENLTEKDYLQNPRSIIRFLRGKTYYYYHIETAYKFFIINNNKLDPYTRQPMNSIDISRIIMYYKYYSEFQNHEITSDTVEDILKNLFKPNQNQEELNKLIPLARGIIQPEDVVNYISNIINSGNKIDRNFTQNYLKDKPESTFIFRDSSIGSTQYAKVFVLSIIRDGITVHIPYVHIYGRGLFELDASKIESSVKLSENPDKIDIIHNRAYVSIIDLLINHEPNLLQHIQYIEYIQSPPTMTNI